MIHAVLRSMILEYQMNKVIFPVGPKFLVLSVTSVKAGNMPRMHCVPRSVGYREFIGQEIQTWES